MQEKIAQVGKMRKEVFNVTNGGRKLAKSPMHEGKHATMEGEQRTVGGGRRRKRRARVD